MMRAWMQGIVIGTILVSPGRDLQRIPPHVVATSALVMNATNQQILYAKNIHQRWPPGSLVKIMTAWLAIRYGWHKTGRITAADRHLGGAMLGFPSGTIIPLDRLVPAMMMASGNDAAMAVACTVSGTASAFVRQMNYTAARWHLHGIRFSNPTGLPSTNQWTTAAAMAGLAQHVMKNGIFATMVREPSVTLFNQKIARFYPNQNQLIGEFPGANGIKLGYTRGGGATLVATARRRHTELIVVLLHDNLADVWPDAMHLFSWGFSKTPSADHLNRKIPRSMIP